MLLRTNATRSTNVGQLVLLVAFTILTTTTTTRRSNNNNNNAVWALENGQARTPPMGWMAWERFTCELDCHRYPNECINEQLFKQQAKRLAEDGYLEAGYQYVSIDDCWSELERGARQQLVANSSRFPSGLRSLADELHAQGLKLGLYGDCGMKTCAGYPAQLNKRDELSTGEANHFELDARSLVNDWHIDAFKFDGCHVQPLKAENLCPAFSRALFELGLSAARPVMLTCEWPFYMMYTHIEPDWQVVSDACNVWRYYDDIEDSWLSILNTIDYTVRHQSTIVEYHGPGHWFDPDQLVIGNFGLSYGQARAQMALWSIWSAPLYMSNDLRHIDVDSAQILKNNKLIGVNQDKLGVFGQMVAQSSDSSKQVFVKPIEPLGSHGCPSFALVYLSRSTLGNREKVSFKLSSLLKAAPIRQAAKNQRQVLAYEIGIDNYEPPFETRIRPGECLKHLRELSGQVEGVENKLQWWHQSSTNGSTLVFDVEDLYGEKGPDRIGIDEQLELWVEPQSVRVVKLTERKV